MTRGAVEGYTGSRIWDPSGVAYGGASIKRWADIDGLGAAPWASFDAKQAAVPAEAFWFGLCTDKTPGNDAAGARVAIAELRRRVPGAVVYVSPQPGYTDGHVCPIAGAGGPAAMAAVASEVVASGDAIAGPPQGPLTAAQTSDACHANAAGKTVLGNQLVDYFG